MPAVVGPSRLKESKTDVLPQLLEEVLSDSCPSGTCPKWVNKSLTYGPGPFQAAASALDFWKSEIMSGTFKSRVSVSYSPLVLPELSPDDFSKPDIMGAHFYLQEWGMPNMGFEPLTSRGRPPCLCHPFCLWVTARCFSNCCFSLGSRGEIACSIWEGNLHFLQHFVTSGHQPCWFSKPDVLGFQFSIADPRGEGAPRGAPLPPLGEVSGEIPPSVCHALGMPPSSFVLFFLSLANSSKGQRKDLNFKVSQFFCC